MAYIDPITVTSPKLNWHLIEVIRNEGDGDAALAVGTWNGLDGRPGQKVLAMRWNGDSAKQSGVGNPQSRGVATWFVLPAWMNAAVLASDVIPAEKKALVAALLQGR